jgi:hypothetical protein
MTESSAASPRAGRAPDGASRLLALVDRSEPPHRPVGGLVHAWYAASGTALWFGEWADPATERLARVFERQAPLGEVEAAIVAFAQARAGADHEVEAVTADLVALVRLAWPVGRGTWGEIVDPVGLLARALGAWATERSAATSCNEWIDAVTGLVSVHYLRQRLRELHDQCRVLAISPAMAFGAVLVHLGLAPSVAHAERMRVRVTAGRLLTARFRGGETVAALDASRLAVVMPAYGLARGVEHVTSDLAGLAALDGVDLTIGRTAFAGEAAATLRALAGTSAGA